MMDKVFIEMINEHRGIIYKVCQLYCQDKEYQKDLFQEIVLQLWKSFPSFRNEAKRSTWMYRIALNTAITSFRKEKKIPPQRTISSAEFEIPDLGSNPDDHEHMGLLKRAIERLSQIEKAIILLYLEEKSYQEIGEIMGITKTNAGVKINRIKIKLEGIIKTAENELR